MENRTAKNGIKQAVEFAREILEKERQIAITKNDKAKRDFRISVHKDREELVYYCACKHLSVREVMREARR